MPMTVAEMDVKIGAETSGAEQGIGAVNSHLTSMMGVVATAGAAAVAAFGVMGVAGTKLAGDLQQGVANISTIKPDIDTSAVFNSINAMTLRVPQSSKALADGLYDIFSSVDVTQAQALTLLETFAKGAVGAQTDAQTFGTSIMGVMNAYGLSVGDAAHISDVFFNTVNAGVVTGPELAASLGPVTQAAKAAGVSVDQLGGFIAGVTKEGGPAAQNINNLNNFFQKITTKEARAQLTALGVSTVDAQGKFRNIQDVMGDFKDKLKDMTESQRADWIQKVFPDAQARQAAQTILSQMDFINAAVDTNVNKAGSAEDAYKKMSATFNSQLELVKNGGLAILTQLGANVLPLITPIIAAFNKQLPDAITTFQLAFAGNWADDSKILPLHRAVGLLGTAMRIAGETAQVFAAKVGEIAAAFERGGIGAALAVVLKDLTEFGGKAANAIGAALPGIVAQLALWGGQLVEWVSPYIPPLLAKLGELATQLLGWIASQVGPLLAKLSEWGQQFVAWIAPQIPPLLSALAGLIGQLFSWIGSQVGPLLSQLAAWGAQFIAWVAPQIGPMLQEAARLAAQLIEWIAGQVPGLVDNLIKWGTEFVEWVAPRIPLLIAALVILGAQMTAWILEQIPGIVAKLLEWAAKFSEWVLTDAQPKLLAALATLGMEMLTWVSSQIPGLNAKLLEWAAAFVEWVADAAGKLPGALVQIGAALTSWIGTTAGSIAGETVNIGVQIINGVVSGIQSVAGNIASAAATAVTDAVAAAKRAVGIASPSKKMHDEVGVPMADGITTGIKAGAPAVHAAAGAVVSDAMQPATAAMQKLFWEGLGKQMPASITAGIQSGAPAVKAAAGSIVTDAAQPATLAMQKLFNEDMAKKIPAAVVTTMGKATAATKSGMGDMTSTVTAGVKTAAGAMNQASSETTKAAMNVGDGIMAGIALGINQNQHRVIEALRGAMGNAIGQTKGALGIKSPSSVFAAEVGQPISQGVAAGIMGAGSLIGDALASVTDTGATGGDLAVSGFEGGSGSGGAGAPSGGGGGMTIHLTVNGSVLTPDDLVDAIYSGLLRKQKRTGALGFA